MNKIALIDLDSVCFSIASGNKVLDKFKQPVKVDGKFVYTEKTEEELYQSADFFMTDILNSSEATHYIGFIKGKGNYRYTINPEYKANRPKESPTWWKSVKEYLIEKWKAVEVNGIEVDDAVNISRQHVKDSFICAIDKDLLSLEGKHFNWRKKEWITTSKDEAVYKFWIDMIAGQSGDNIKGLPGKGIKYAEKLFADPDILIDDNYAQVVLQEYIINFNEEEGINQFYSNYKSLKILDKYKDFIIPQLVEYKHVEIN